MFDDVDVVAHVAGGPACDHDGTVYVDGRPVSGWALMGQFRAVTLLGAPVVSVPVGRSQEGRPLSRFVIRPDRPCVAGTVADAPAQEHGGGMSTVEPLLPGPEHPITITPFAGTVRVSLGDRRLAETSHALELREASYPPVLYVPLADVDDAELLPSPTMSYCPYKGTAGYYGLRGSGGDDVPDAVWFYAEPYPSVAQIAGHVAFYPDRVAIDVVPAGS